MGLFRRRPSDLVDSTATVRAMGPTPKGARQTGKLDVEYEFTLEVAGSSGPVSLTCVVPHDRMPLLGQSVPVRVSASDPSRVEIDFARVPSLAERAMESARAAQAGDSAEAARALGFEPRPPDEPSGG